MTVERLRDTLDAVPFRPFVMHTADGRNIRVPHRECVAYYPTHPRSVVIIDADDRMHVLDMLLVVELEVDPPTKAGQARRKRP